MRLTDSKANLTKSTGKNKFPRFYLTILAAIALLIVIQNSVFFIQEREAFDQHSRESIELEGLNLANEFQSQSEYNAAQCLNDGGLLELADGSINDSRSIIEFDLKLQEIVQKHPIADNIFLLTEGGLLFPQLKPERPYSPLDRIDDRSSSEEKDFASLFREAKQESERRRFDAAIGILEKCLIKPVSDDLKAHALDLLARVYRAANNPTNAVRIWNRLEDQFPDCLNEFYVPYALVAAIEIDELDAGRNTNRKETLVVLYRDLLNGRWPLSEEVILNLKDRLEKRLDYATPSIGDTPYLKRFRTARLVGKALAERGILTDGADIHSFAVVDGQDGVQIYYRGLNEKKAGSILAVSVNSEWARTDLLDNARIALNSPISNLKDFQIEPAASSESADVTIPFKGSYEFWELRLPEGAISQGQLMYRFQLTVIALIALTTIFLLILIMRLIMRITREKMTVQIRSDFLSHVSHELKTPLTLIQLYTETLMTDETLDESDRLYSLKVISRESSHLLNLIENLLHLSGTEKTSEKYEFAPEDIGALIEKTAAVYGEWLRKQGVSIKTNIAPALPKVQLDGEKVTRAFLNLIDNARKYGGNNGPIEIGLWAEDGKVILEVRDHGPGIAESERKLIFDQFYRGSLASESRGVGLGLFLVSETMKAHKGSVELDTEFGKGSAFRLVFPVGK